jgi:hypothetical protein
MSILMSQLTEEPPPPTLARTAASIDDAIAWFLKDPRRPEIGASPPIEAAEPWASGPTALGHARPVRSTSSIRGRRTSRPRGAVAVKAPSKLASQGVAVPEDSKRKGAGSRSRRSRHRGAVLAVGVVRSSCGRGERAGRDEEPVKTCSCR